MFIRISRPAVNLLWHHPVELDPTGSVTRIPNSIINSTRISDRAGQRNKYSESLYVGRSGFEPRWGKEMFFSRPSRPAPRNLLYHGYGGSFPGLKSGSVEPGLRSWYSDSLRAGRSGDRIPVGARFSAPVQTNSEAYPVSYTMGTVSFPGVKRPGRGVEHPPPSSAEVKEREELYLYFPSGPSWPVIGWTLPFNFQSGRGVALNTKPIWRGG